MLPALEPSPRIVLCRYLSVALCVLFFYHAAEAEKLPLKFYSSADGLATSAIGHVARDSQGFLWFSGRDGLSRFDGTEFVNYRLPETATSQTFRYFLETRDGWIWVATDGGLYRTRREEIADIKPRPESDRRDRVLDAKKVWDAFVYLIFEDSRGTLWIGGSKLHRIDERDGDRIGHTTIETPHTDLTQVFSIAEGGDGSLWLSQLPGPLRILPDGRQIFYPIDGADRGDEVYGIEVADDGRVWYGQAGGVFVFQPETIDELGDVPSGTVRRMDVSSIELGTDGTVILPTNSAELLRMTFAPATSVFETRGRMAVAMGASLFIFEGDNYRRVGGTDILTGNTRSMNSDGQGDLWLGSTGGVISFVQDGFSTFNADDGLVDPQVSSIFESVAGDLLVAHGLWRVSRFTKKGFESQVLRVPGDARYTWTSDAVTTDGQGNLYALAREGMFRFSSMEDVTAEEFPDLAGRPFYRAFTSRDGKIWFSLRGYTEQNGLLRFDPQTGVFEDMTALPGFPKGKTPAAFTEDASGNLWLGFYGVGGLLKYSNGEFREFDLGVEHMRGVFGLHSDTKGRLWIGTASHGVLRIRDTSRESFEIERIGEQQGLASNNVRAMVPDPDGNVYVGTVQGVDRVSIETDAIRHFSTDDGLAGDFINAAFRDRNGALWFGTPNGVSKLVPPKEEDSTPPLVFINELQIAGEQYGISQFGQETVSGLDLSASQNNLQITAAGVGSKLRYQYRLAGSTNEEWSTPSATRNFNFANLASGNYTLYVRAISRAGLPSERPASVSFVINPAFYRSWWFLTLATLLVVGSVIVLDRYRVAKTRQIQTAYDDLRKSEEERRLAEAALEHSRVERLAELERVRLRIATDLHDDIGSSLTQIAVLSQAAHNEAEQRGVTMSTPLQRISDVSIELVNAMSDIVWAINPRRDNLRDLVQRMRRFAADVFTSSGIRFEFHAPRAENKLAIGANIRREVFAVFKEAVNNVMRHSGATKARIELAVTDEVMTMQIIDNGRGFDPEAILHMSQAPESGGGNGLVNMRRRTGDLGGTCDIEATPGAGTKVTIAIPLTGRVTSHSAGEVSTPNDLDLSRNGND